MFRLVAEFQGHQAVLRFRVEPAAFRTQFDVVRELGGEAHSPGVVRGAMRVEALRFASREEAIKKCIDLNNRSCEWDGI